MKKQKSFILCILASVVCLLTSSSFSSTTICKWKDNKAGAYSMSFDDSMYTHNNYVIPNLISRGLTGTFFVNPGSIMYGNGIMTWENLCSRTGMDMADHSMNHIGSTSPEMTEYEVSEPQRVLWLLRTPAKSKLSLFLAGGGTVWNPSPSGYLADYYCISGRGNGLNEAGTNGLAFEIANANEAISSGNWTGYHWHGVGPDAEYLYFDRNWNAGDFITFIDYLVTVSTQLWIGANTDVHMYNLERQNAVVNSTQTTNDIQITLVSTGVDPALYDYPLTLITDVPSGWNFCKITQDGLITIKQSASNKVMFEAIPNRGEVLISSCTGMDTSSPTVTGAEVNDGAGVDIDVVTDLYNISANWSGFTDPETGISRYWYKLGATPGGNQIFDWIDNGTFTYVATSRTNVALSRGVTYYITVKAVNGAGLSAEKTSDGQCAERAQWSVKFFDGFETGNLSKWNTILLSTSNPVNTTASGVYPGGMYSLACHVQDKTVSYISRSNVNMLNDAFLKFNLKLTDMSIPQLVKSGSGDEDANWVQKILRILTVTDENGDFLGGLLLGNDDDTGINLYFEYVESYDWVCAPNWPGKYSGYLPISTGTWHTIDIHVKADNNVKGGVEIWLDGDKVQSALRRSFTKSIRNLEIGVNSIGDNISGDIYFDNITVSDCLYTPLGPGIEPVFDGTPPQAVSQVNEGTASDLEKTNLTTELSAHWTASSDPESGIAKYYYALGTAQGATNITNGWLSSGANLSVTKTGLALTVGTTYYFTVKAENGAGFQSNAVNSNGIYIEAITPPPAVITQPKPFPNPYRFDASNPVTFQINGTAGGEVKIFSANGDLVRKILAGTGATKIEWDGTNDKGEKLSSGIYLYKITDSGERKGKIALIK